MSALMLALCWLPPLLHGYWLMGNAVKRHVEESAHVTLMIDSVIDQQREVSQYRYTIRNEWVRR